MVWKGSGHVEEEVCPGLEGGDEMAGFHHGGYRRVAARGRARCSRDAGRWISGQLIAGCM